MAGPRAPITLQHRLVAYALARTCAAPNRPPPEWLGVFTWAEAYDLFYPALGAGRTRTGFRKTLQHLRDEFGMLMPGWPTTWTFATGRAPLSAAAEAFARAHVRTTDAALRQAVAAFLPQGAVRAA